MAARAYWSGQIRLSLVSIPVQVFPATKSSAKISFHQVYEPSGERIRYQKVAPSVGPVESEDIVKGYEVEKGKFVLMSDKEIDKIKLEAKKSIDLVQFVDSDEIDAIYYDRPFFVLPEADGDAEAFVVLRDALRKTKKVGLGQIVIRGKGSVVAIKPCGKGLMMETLRYADEVKKADAAFKVVPAVKTTKEMLDLAEELIERKSKPFDANAFKDSYEEALHELIEAKAEHRQVRNVEEPQQSAKVIDLMDALRRSVKGKEAAKKAADEAKAPAKRSSHARKAAGHAKKKRATKKKAA
jgi:DNA end-binding protein Ku